MEIRRGYKKLYRKILKYLINIKFNFIITYFFYNKIFILIGAEGGIRTLTLLRAIDFESIMSTVPSLPQILFYFLLIKLIFIKIASSNQIIKDSPWLIL